ncbi:MAG: CinA family protein [Anaerolineae bacterium]
METTQPLEVQLGEVLKQRHWTVSSAESCTGGLVMHRLTNIPGSSDYVIGGIVCYSNQVKHEVLKVKQETLDAYGAVSEQTAREMVLGALALFRTTFAVAITGIAGPGGGTPTKPVGLTYISAARAGDEPIVRRHVWNGDREAVKTASAEEALRMVLELAAKA